MNKELLLVPVLSAEEIALLQHRLGVAGLETTISNGDALDVDSSLAEGWTPVAKAYLQAQEAPRAEYVHVVIVLYVPTQEVSG